MSNLMILDLDILNDEVVCRKHPVIIRGLEKFLDIGKFFDLHRASVRVLRCSRAKGSFEVIKRYSVELSE